MLMERQPTRITPEMGSGEIRIVTFRDGPQLLPIEFVKFADSDSYPDLTYQEWIHRVVNQKIETAYVSKALVLARTGHFAG